MDDRPADMASADATDKNEIIRGMAENPINIMGEQPSIRIGPERQDGQDIALCRYRTRNPENHKRQRGEVLPAHIVPFPRSS